MARWRTANGAEPTKEEISTKNDAAEIPKTVESGTLKEATVKEIPLMPKLEAAPLMHGSGYPQESENVEETSPGILKEVGEEIPVALDSKTHLKEKKEDVVVMIDPGTLEKEKIRVKSDVENLNEEKKGEVSARPTVFRKCKETGDVYIVSAPCIPVVPSSRTHPKEEKKYEVLLMASSATPKEVNVKSDVEILKDEKKEDISELKRSFTISDLPSIMTLQEIELLFHPKYDMHTYSYGGGVSGCTIVFPSPEEALEGAKFVEGLMIQGLRVCVEENCYHDGLRKIWLTNTVTGLKACRKVS